MATKDTPKQTYPEGTGRVAANIRTDVIAQLEAAVAVMRKENPRITKTEALEKAIGLLAKAYKIT